MFRRIKFTIRYFDFCCQFFFSMEWSLFLSRKSCVLIFPFKQRRVFCKSFTVFGRVKCTNRERNTGRHYVWIARSQTWARPLGLQVNEWNKRYSLFICRHTYCLTSRKRPIHRNRDPWVYSKNPRIKNYGPEGKRSWSVNG